MFQLAAGTVGTLILGLSFACQFAKPESKSKSEPATTPTTIASETPAVEGATPPVISTIEVKDSPKPQVITRTDGFSPLPNTSSRVPAPAKIFLTCASKQNALSLYSSGEHNCLGDSGFAAGCGQVNFSCANLSKIPNGDESLSFSYGQLVALMGDFFGAPENLYDFKQAEAGTFSPDFADITAYFDKELVAIRGQLSGIAVEYPDFGARYAKNAPSSLTLLAANTPHFGWNNMVFYVKYHGQAIDLAAKAFALEPRMPNSKLLHQALYVGAFADHFLTDGFASGHVRTPRKQILEYCQSHGLNTAKAGTLSKILHDHDGRVPSGLYVKNASGTRWQAPGDGELFVIGAEANSRADLPLRAVAASVSEILTAYQSGKKPSGIYAATMFVPFPDLEHEQKLSELFSTNLDDKILAIKSDLSIFGKIPFFSAVSDQEMKDFFGSLPELMRNFQQQVRGEASENAELSLRLPTTYIEAYKVIE